VKTPHRQLGPVCVAIAISGLSACSGQATAPEGLRGVGTPDVSSYLGDGQATSVQALLERCRQTPEHAGPNSNTRGLEAACSQLHRTMRNQPGNTEQPRGNP